MADWRRMFPYFGGKRRLAQTYPAPLYDTIVEPFAGGAGYAMHWMKARPDLRLIVVELNPLVAELWRWLLQPGAAERVAALPDVKAGQRTSNPLVALTNSSTSPINSIINSGDCAITKWHEENWPRHRAEIAQRCRDLRGRVQVIQGQYTDAPDLQATWFVDPPYQYQGWVYKESANNIDYSQLGEWCLNRSGQTIVTEAEPANWLPFEKHRRSRDTKGQLKTELVWYDPEHAPLRLFGSEKA